MEFAPDRVKELLGFPRTALLEPAPAGSVLDIASVAGVAPGATPRAPMTAPAIS
jgi:hypothetical protein